MANRLHHKLRQKYFGPYEISKKVNEMSYTLKLPENNRIHPTFHISRLKKLCGPILEHAPFAVHVIAVDNQPGIYPIVILDHRKVLLGGK